MPTPYDDCITVARAELCTARALIQAEIRQYPAPISGCDAQFNHLLAERQRVSAALETLNEPAFIPTPRSPTPDAGVESR